MQGFTSLRRGMHLLISVPMVYAGDMDMYNEIMSRHQGSSLRGGFESDNGQNRTSRKNRKFIQDGQASTEHGSSSNNSGPDVQTMKLGKASGIYQQQFEKLNSEKMALGKTVKKLEKEKKKLADDLAKKTIEVADQLKKLNGRESDLERNEQLMARKRHDIELDTECYSKKKQDLEKQMEAFANDKKTLMHTMDAKIKSMTKYLTDQHNDAQRKFKNDMIAKLTDKIKADLDKKNCDKWQQEYRGKIEEYKKQHFAILNELVGNRQGGGNATITFLQQQLQETNSKLTKLANSGSTMEDKDGTIEHQRQRIANLVAEKEYARDELMQEQQKNEQRMRLEKKQYDKLYQDLEKQKDKEIAELRKQHEARKVMHTGGTTTINTMKAERKQIKSDLAKYQHDVEHLERCIEGKDRYIFNLQRENTSLAEQYEVAKKQLDAGGKSYSAKENEDLLRENASFHKLLSETQKQVNDVEKKYENQRKENRQLKNETREAKALVNSIRRLCQDSLRNPQCTVANLAQDILTIDAEDSDDE